MRCLRCTGWIFLAMLTAASTRAVAENWVPVASTSSSVLIEQDTRLGNLPPIQQQFFFPDQDEDIKLTSIVQLFPVDPTLLGVRRARKAQGRASVACLTPRGQRSLGSRKVRGDENGNLVFNREVSANLDCDFFIIQWEFLKKLEMPAGASIDLRSAAELVAPRTDAGCYAPEALCLGEDRFRVEVDWRDSSGTSGPGIAFPRTDDSGTFFFFNEDNTEMLLKVLDGCQRNDHYWVFYAATTNVEFEVTVTDTLTDQSRVYQNPLGQPAPPIQDTRAFATCP